MNYFEIQCVRFSNFHVFIVLKLIKNIIANDMPKFDIMLKLISLNNFLD